MHIEEELPYSGIGISTLTPSFFLVPPKLLGILCDSLDSLIVGNMHQDIVIYLFSSGCLPIFSQTICRTKYAVIQRGLWTFQLILYLQGLYLNYLCSSWLLDAT